MLPSTYLKAAVALFISAILFAPVFWFSLNATQNIAFSALFAFFAVTNAVMIVVLTRVWLVKKYPAVERWLERIPGIHFSTPVPEHLKAGRSRPVEATPEPYAQRTMLDSSVSGSESTFTLGTLEFEPPEPIKPVPSEPVYQNAPPVLTQEPAPLLKKVVAPSKTVTVEKAFRKTAANTQQIKREDALARLHVICRSLKQANMEVAVWTESELATLANTLLGPKSDDKDMVALLLPQNVVKVNCSRTFDFEHHAQVLNNIVLATGRQMGVNFTNSTKDENSGQCVVNFEYQGEPVTWRFIEQGNQLSEKFLKSTLTWVAKRANGKFFPLESRGTSKSFVFLPNAVLMTLQSDASHEVA